MDDRLKQIEVIRENHRRLNSCLQHNFEETEETTVRVYCSKCGGYTSLEGSYWYNEGLKHGLNNKIK